LASALLRLMHGEPMEDVKKLVLDPAHISEREFAGFRRPFRSADQVEEYLRKCNVKYLRESNVREKRYDLLVRNLSTFVKDAAARTGKPFNRVAEDIWAQLTDGPGGMVILDPSLSKPKFTEVVTP